MIRAVLGSKVLSLLIAYSNRIDFFAPDTAFEESRAHLPWILEKRHIDPEKPLAILDSLYKIIREVDNEAYGAFENVARQRLLYRDQDDWPILAAALALRCPIWTEDADFFGCDVPAWTTDRVEIYLKEIAS